MVRAVVCLVLLGCSIPKRPPDTEAPDASISRPDASPRPDAAPPIDSALPDSALPDAPSLPPQPIVQIVAGHQHTCVLLGDGRVRCWGNNEHGQLGYPGLANVGVSQTPNAVGDVDVGGVVESIAAGGFHTCAILVGGVVRCWGFGASGVLGYGNTNNIGDNETPASAGDVALGAPAKSLALAPDHTCAVLTTGAVRCWGAGNNGALGYANTNTIGDNESPLAIDVDIGIADVTTIATSGPFGGGYTCAVGGGNLSCWGDPGSGRLGRGNLVTIGDNETPASAGFVPVGDVNVSSVAVGAAHVCATGSTGVRCWGEGANGRSGHGSTIVIGDDELASAAATVDVGGTVKQLALGGAHSCARLDNGGVRCWGMGTFGQLGYANTVDVGDDEAPSAVGDVDLGAPAITIAAGLLHTCAIVQLATSHAVRCWGQAGQGALGYGNANTIGDTETPASAGDVAVQ